MNGGGEGHSPQSISNNPGLLLTSDSNIPVSEYGIQRFASNEFPW